MDGSSKIKAYTMNDLEHQVLAIALEAHGKLVQLINSIDLGPMVDEDGQEVCEQSIVDQLLECLEEDTGLEAYLHDDDATHPIWLDSLLHTIHSVGESIGCETEWSHRDDVRADHRHMTR